MATTLLQYRPSPSSRGSCYVPPGSRSSLGSFGSNLLFPNLSNYRRKLSFSNVFACRSISTREPPQEDESPLGTPNNKDNGKGDGDEGGAMSLLYSALIFAIWAGFVGYCAFLSPNLTPVTDRYFLERLLFLKGDDGFQLNQVLFCLWNIMGLWPAIYWMLLIPTGRSSKSRVPVWPFTSLSFFVGAFALLPYFALWQPPAPRLSKEAIQGWPLKLLDSKILSTVVTISGIGLLGVAAFAGGDSWAEFIRYFNSSRFIHIMSLDFVAMSLLAPFWVFNDMEVRKWSNGGNWITTLAFLPFVGPALYLVMRPSLKGENAE